MRGRPPFPRPRLDEDAQRGHVAAGCGHVGRGFSMIVGRIQVRSSLAPRGAEKPLFAVSPNPSKRTLQNSPGLGQDFQRLCSPTLGCQVGRRESPKGPGTQVGSRLTGEVYGLSGGARKTPKGAWWRNFSAAAWPSEAAKCAAVNAFSTYPSLTHPLKSVPASAGSSHTWRSHTPPHCTVWNFPTPHGRTALRPSTARATGPGSAA